MQEKRELSAQARVSKNRVKDSEPVRSGRVKRSRRRVLSRTHNALFRMRRAHSVQRRILSRAHSSVLLRIRSGRAAARARNGRYRIHSARAGSGRSRPRSARTDRSPVLSDRHSGPGRLPNVRDRAARRLTQPAPLRAGKAPDKPSEAAAHLPREAER